MTDLGQARFAVHAESRLMVTGIQSRESHRLAGIAKSLRRTVEGEQDDEGAFPDSRDTIEPGLLVAQAWIGIDVIMDGLDNPFNPLI